MSEPDKPQAEEKPKRRGIRKLLQRLITVVAVLLVIAVIAVGAYRALQRVFGWGVEETLEVPQVQPQPEWNPLQLVPLDTTIADVAEKVLPSVVTVTTTKLGGEPQTPLWFLPAPAPRNREGLGSGVVVRDDGYIVTNYHVVSRADDIRVTLHTGQELSAQVVGSEPSVDLTLLKVDRRGLTPVTFGDSDSLRIGALVLAVGNPLGVGQTVTMGIISAKNRRLGLSAYENFLQTDAAINPGNSGGALVDLEGNLVGVSSAISSSDGGYQGIGFAIPSNLVDETVRALISGERPRRGWIGVTMQNLSPQLARYFGLDQPSGVLTIDVAPGHPAQAAGIKPRDIIIAVDGEPIVDMEQLRNVIGLAKPGAQMNFKVWRDGAPLELSVTLSARPDTP
ncbi:MAG: trypsin-like peptidase domain-containing protein [Candidatus Alcyoniella australis]|nr:trypsin-like peptidase domain-containing protein [Candidatus Alcyoniella australis]